MNTHCAVSKAQKVIFLPINYTVLRLNMQYIIYINNLHAKLFNKNIQYKTKYRLTSGLKYGIICLQDEINVKNIFVK